MPTFGPVSQRDLIRFMRQLGFQGPFSGGRHQFMAKGDTTVFIPNPREGDIGRGLLARLLGQAGIDRSEWEAL